MQEAASQPSSHVGGGAEAAAKAKRKSHQPLRRRRAQVVEAFKRQDAPGRDRFEILRQAQARQPASQPASRFRSTHRFSEALPAPREVESRRTRLNWTTLSIWILGTHAPVRKSG